MPNSQLYAAHLERVSRSFSFCIARLDGEFRHQVALSYLILRVLDTIEDALWTTRDAQLDSFHKFNGLISDSMAGQFEIENWSKWVQEFPQNIPDHERSLLLDSHFLFADLGHLERSVQQAIVSAIFNMSRGMEFFQVSTPENRQLTLGSLAELNCYCFFVAGVVGELLTDLLSLNSHEFMTNSKIYGSAIQFGLFLQKINILKDQIKDEQEGRQLIQSRADVLASLKDDVLGAFDYLCSIPKSEVGYRLFCGWSLFIGLESLPWIEKSWAVKILDKIPRNVTKGILGEIEKIILDDEALRIRFQQLKNAIAWQGPRLSSLTVSSSTAWISAERFSKLYSGHLEIKQLSVLGVLPKDLGQPLSV